MASKIEQLDPISKVWNPIVTLSAGEQKTLAQNLPGGEKLLYVVLRADDDTKTSVYKTPRNEVVMGNGGEFFGDSKDLVLVTEITGGKEYIVTLRQDGANIGRLVRFSHE